MSFNVKHYVAIALGLAVCATFVLHQPETKTSKEPATFEAVSGQFTPLNMLVAQSEPAPLTEDNSMELTSPEIMVGELMEQADQLVFNDENNDFDPSNSGEAPSSDTFELTGAELEESDESNVVNVAEDMGLEMFIIEDEPSQPEITPPADFTTNDSAAPTTVASNDTTTTYPVAEQSPQSSVTHHFERPNSRWKRNPFMDQASAAPVAAEVQAEPVTESDSIIVEMAATNESPASELETQVTSNNDFEMPANEAERSVLMKLDSSGTDNANIVSNESVTPSMPSQIQEFDSTNFANIAPARMAISDAVAQQAAHHIEYGKSLARRGATQAAGQEFLTALKVVAQANDSVAQSNEFSQALAHAVLAMKEAEDFVKPNVQAQMIVEVSAITESHRSNIIGETQASRTTPSQAMTKYYAFAQQKLDQAGGRNAVTAEAFYCLGKLHTAASVNKSVPNNADVAKAITYHQAALLSDSNNHRSANELGVLMAKTGQLAEATSLFKQSLIANPTPQTWKNLAKTHQRMGDTKLAELANTEFAIAAQTRNADSTIHWMPTTKFNESAPLEFSDNTRVASRPTTPIAPSNVEQNKKPQQEEKTLSEKFKDLF